MMADAEVAAAEKLLLAAEIQHARALLEKEQWSSEISEVGNESVELMYQQAGTCCTLVSLFITVLTSSTRSVV